MDSGISIVICSKNEALLNVLKENVSATIGVSYEFIIKDNKIDNEGLCAVYNKCAAKAKYPYLCFIHEDIHIYTNNWGATLIDFTKKQKNVGLLGVAGTQSMSKYPYPWWCHDSMSNKINLIQGNNSKELNWTNNDPQESLKVLVLDGVFLFCRKDIWEEFRFDEQTFPNFHYYDLDFSFNVAQKYDNYVMSKILIKHFSMGRLNNDWFLGSKQFCKKWENSLPKSLCEDSLLRMNDLGHKHFLSYIRLMVLQTSFGYKKTMKEACSLQKDMKQISKTTLSIYLLIFYINKLAIKTYHHLWK